MHNILKFNHTNTRKVFFVSDLHYSHAKLLESRGFATVNAMNQAIIDNWNNTVTNNDTVFMLGDLVLGAGDKSAETYEYLLNTLNYREIFIMQGNHFGGGKGFWTAGFDKNGIDQFYRITHFIKGQISDSKAIHFIPNYYEVFVGNVRCILCHYPVLSWNEIRHNSVLIFGHCHGSLAKNEWLRNNYLNTKCIDVGWENYRRPLAFNEIMDIMKGRPILAIDHHAPEN